MEKADVSRWLDDYVQAWKSYDRDAIGALFSDDVSYRLPPLRRAHPRPRGGRLLLVRGRRGGGRISR